MNISHLFAFVAGGAVVLVLLAVALAVPRPGPPIIRRNPHRFTR